MLRALRNQTQSISFKIFLVLLVCGFALWGVGDLTGGSNSKPILETNNQKITLERAINELDRARYSTPSRPSLKEILESQVSKNILNNLEQEILLNSEGKDLNLHVPVSIMTKTISQENSFKDPLGKFSKTKFAQSLKNAGLSEKKYLSMLKTEVNLKQISTPFEANDHYNEKIIKKIIDWQNEIRTVDYDVFELIDKNNIQKPSQTIIKDFFEKNKNKYKIPLTRKIQFIEIKPSDFQTNIKVTEEQLKDKYNTDKSNYIIEEKREILQITTQNENDAKKFVNAIKNNKDFEEVGKKLFKLSKNDINLGLLKKDDLPSTDSDKLFSAKLNEIIGPLKSDFGYKVFTIKKIIPKTEKKYLEVKKEIKDKLIYDLSVETLFEKLDAIEDMIAEGSSIIEISSSNIFDKKLPLKKIDKISKNGMIYSFNENIKFSNLPSVFLKEIWNTDINDISEILNSDKDTYVLLNVLEENPENIPSYEKINKLVYNDWLKDEIVIKSKENAKKLMLNKNFKFTNNGSIKRNSKKLNNIDDQYLINQIFDIKGNDISYINSKNKVFAIKVLKSEVDKYEFKKTLYDQINSSFSKSYFNDFANYYINHLSSKHNLKRNYEELDKLLKSSE